MRGDVKRQKRKLIFYFLLLILVICSLVEIQAKENQLPQISVIYPKEGAQISVSDSTFIFGSVSPKSELKINGHQVEVHPNGAFLAFLPLTPGDFAFELVAKNQAGVSVKRVRVKVPEPIAPVPEDKFIIVKNSIMPKQDLILTAGDVLETKFRGTPDCQASFSIEGVVENVPMVELQSAGIESTSPEPEIEEEIEESVTRSVKGVYTGAYIIKGSDKADKAKIIIKLKKKKGKDIVSIAESSSSRISIVNDQTPQVVEFIGSSVIGRSGPRMGYTLLYQPPGIRAVATGKIGEWVRLKLAYGENAWVHQDSIKYLPLGTPIPKSILTTIQTKKLERKTKIELLLSSVSGKLPFKVEQQTEPSALFLTVYGLTSNTDWIRYDSNDDLIKEIKWDQPQEGEYLLKIFLNQKQQWGYDVFYEGDNLVMEIKHTPDMEKRLEGLKICLDPGHSPDPGAVGPTGLAEKEVNLKIAQYLKKMLEERGALVIMTRWGDDGVALYDRPKIAIRENCDILISIHNNALPDGVNPFYNNGTATYYYHPQSLALARSIQSELLNNLKLPDYGLYYGNLALTRSYQLLAALVECAFMMIPEQEELLGTEKFQKQCAEAIYHGILNFLESVKE
jgi:N-acetylmuramoyl-L-alanine amidase